MFATGPRRRKGLEFVYFDTTGTDSMPVSMRAAFRRSSPFPGHFGVSSFEQVST